VNTLLERVSKMQWSLYQLFVFPPSFLS
jgi:hypothetical protein